MKTKTMICRTCGQDKPVHEFYKSKSARNGREGECIDCVRERRLRNKREKKERLESYVGMSLLSLAQELQSHAQEIIVDAMHGAKGNKSAQARVRKKSKELAIILKAYHDKTVVKP